MRFRKSRARENHYGRRPVVVRTRRNQLHTHIHAGPAHGAKCDALAIRRVGRRRRRRRQRTDSCYARTTDGNGRKHLWPADGQKANWRMRRGGASVVCVFFYYSPSAAARPHSCATRGGNPVMCVGGGGGGDRVRLARAGACACVYAATAAARDVTRRRPPNRPYRGAANRTVRQRQAYADGARRPLPFGKSFQIIFEKTA